MKLAAIGDIFAIPGFICLSIYFAMIESKTFYEYALMIFSIGACLADIYFTYLECSAKSDRQYASIETGGQGFSRPPLSAQL